MHFLLLFIIAQCIFYVYRHLYNNDTTHAHTINNFTCTVKLISLIVRARMSEAWGRNMKGSCACLLFMHAWSYIPSWTQTIAEACMSNHNNIMHELLTLPGDYRPSESVFVFQQTTNKQSLQKSAAFAKTLVNITNLKNCLPWLGVPITCSN